MLISIGATIINLSLVIHYNIYYQVKIIAMLFLSKYFSPSSNLVCDSHLHKIHLSWLLYEKN